MAFIHPDLGIGGAERLVVDAAIGLQSLGHEVVIYTSHHNPNHCFDETRNGQLKIKVATHQMIVVGELQLDRIRDSSILGIR